MTTETTAVKEKHVRGQFCGYYKDFPVYYSRPHFILGNSGKFVGFLSSKEARKAGLYESPNKTKIYGQHGYIGPDRHKGSKTV